MAIAKIEKKTNLKYLWWAFAILLIIGIGRKVYSKMTESSIWTQTIVINGSYPTTYYSITSDGKCDDDWKYFIWHVVNTEEVNEMDLTFLHAKSKKETRKRPNAGVISLPGQVSVKDNDGRVRKLVIECECVGED